MNSDIWKATDALAQNIQDIMSETAQELNEPIIIDKDNWVNKTWSNDHFRRAHLNVVDMREERKILMLHFCIFPQFHNNSPIFGLDIIAGPKKITGFFHDWSIIDSSNTANMHFRDLIQKHHWYRKRTLPDWGKQIFSEHMLAAGNITEQKELEQTLDISSTSINLYLDIITNYDYNDSQYQTRQMQNRYCYWQKQNPQLWNSMKAFKLSDKEIKSFINDCLFPEV